MTNFHLEFAYSWAPWLFFLLIPAALLTLIPYFRINKKYRKTRNRITSMVLHLLIMTLAITVLTGVTFVYEVGNPDNELILLVDVSDTERNVQSRRDKAVEEILRESTYDNLKVGVVTFGFTQVYAVPLTYDADGAYESYHSAALPDTTATDIAAALRYTRTLFTNPQTAKIVLISDGKETDEKATSAIGSIVAQGTKVDAVCLSASFEEDGVQVTDVRFPDYHVDIGDECEISVTVRSKKNTEASAIEIYDNGQIDVEMTKTLALAEGEQAVSFSKTFDTLGLHEIRVKASESQDGLHENDEFVSYYYVEHFDRVLIIEQTDESGELKALLEREEPAYKVDVLNLNNADAIPTTVDELRAYDQIILNNIANSDLVARSASDAGSDAEPGLDELIYSYVYDYGGGLFTVGGSDSEDKDIPHAYNEADMYGSRYYKQMLPVQAITYTPPVGVIIILDVSGSMGGAGSGTPLDWAKSGAIGLVRDAFTDRDYLGVVTLDTDPEVLLPLTPMTQRQKIEDTISKIDGDGNTVYTAAIQRTGQMLVDQKNVDRRHIILISDGMPGDDASDYLSAVRTNLSNGVTISYVGIGITEGSNSPTENVMKSIVNAGGGRPHYIDMSNLAALIPEMRADVTVPEIKGVTQRAFRPRINDELSPLLDGVEFGDFVDEGAPTINKAMDVELGGFYGVRARANVTPVLVGEYQVPIYAQWKFGAGMVGSFMCDLNGGEWSGDFLHDESGERFLLNVISNLMPTSNIRPNEISAKLDGENYINRLDIYTTLGEGEKVRAEVTDIEAGVTYSLNSMTDLSGGERDIYITLALTEGNKYSRSEFVIKKKGTYRITINKYDAQDEIVASYEMYKTFSYSLEYDQDLENLDPATNLGVLAAQSHGSLIDNDDDLWKVLDGFVSSVRREYDPRWLFMGLAMALFLLDIAVRKFKFKWPHELIRDWKAKRAEEKKGRKGE